MKRLAFYLFIIPLCLLSVLTVAYLFSKDEPLFSLKNVKIKGAAQLTDGEIMRRAYPFLKESIFKTQVDKVKEAVLAHPFVREVSIKRLYPFSLVIEVKEKVASALWVGPTGDVQVLDETGAPFRALSKEDTKQLFVIHANDQVAARSVFNQVNTWMTEKAIKRDSISEVIDTDGSITLVYLGDGVEIILGKEDQKARLKRATAVLEDVRRRGLFIRCIDARFDKGAIIKERKG
ncbi:MAG: cell division protein FtsQ/DivIB [Syntrophorhabdales bacterium]|jgi:cell division protein FtsQ